MKKNWLTLLTLLFAGLAHAESGALQVNGQAGNLQLFQKVKAVRCDMSRRGACDAPVFFDLNKPATVEAGSYIVGFENSIYPEVVTVSPRQTTNLYLETIRVPSQALAKVSSEALAKGKGPNIRVYRDFSSLVEQKKIYLTMFAMKRHFFRLDKNNFGDLYLTGAWERDFVQRFTYEGCTHTLNNKGNENVPRSAVSICESFKNAKQPSDIREAYNFSNDGTFQEMWVTFPGDVIPSKHPRYLVSAPMTGQDFVAVFPGVYKVQAEGENQPAITVKAGNVSQNATTFGFSLNTIKSFISLNGEGCSSARTWKTESRAYCTSDQLEGCNRSTAESCEPM